LRLKNSAVSKGSEDGWNFSRQPCDDLNSLLFYEVFHLAAYGTAQQDVNVYLFEAQRSSHGHQG